MALAFTVTPAGPVPHAERERLLAGPAFGEVFTDHVHHQMVGRPRLARRATRTVGPPPAGPVRSGLPLRAGGLRGHEGLPPPGRLGGHLPAVRQRRADAPLLRPDGHARAPRGVPTSRPWSGWSAPTSGGSANGRDTACTCGAFMIATQRTLGFYQPSAEYLFVVIASPAAATSGQGPRRCRSGLSREYARAAPGGTGAATCGGNYAGTPLAMAEAQRHGCDQVVWLDPAERSLGGGDGHQQRVASGHARADGHPAGRDHSGLASEARPGPGVPGGGGPDQRGTVARGRGVRRPHRDPLPRHLLHGHRPRAQSGARRTPGARGRSAGAAGPVTLRLREELAGLQSGTRPDPYGWVHKLA